MKCLRAPALHRAWLTLLDQPHLIAAVRRDAHLFERWQHRWVSLRFSPASRLRRQLQHYNTLPGLVPTQTLRSMYDGEHAPIASAPLKDGSLLTVFLAAPVKRCLEGELLVGLAWHGRTMFSMTVTLCPDTGELVVGCIQGPQSTTGLDDVRELTRLCHGLRPKNLLLSMISTLAQVAGLATIRGVSNQTQVFAGTGRVKADYDVFWTEAGAALRDDALYELPAVETPRSVLDVPSKHRSAFRQKEALREELKSQFVALLAASQGQPVALASTSADQSVEDSNVPCSLFPAAAAA